MHIRKLPTEEYFLLVKEQLSLSGEAYVRVTGSSMQPMLRHMRDGVILTLPGSIRWGDVVLFDRQNGRYALHRVIGITKGGFHMAGDSQWHMEKALPYSQIVGVVSHIVRDETCISVRRFPWNLYGFVITAAAFPRIYVYKTLRFLLSPFLTLFRSPKKRRNG